MANRPRRAASLAAEAFMAEALQNNQFDDSEEDELCSRPPPKRIRASSSAGMNFLASIDNKMAIETAENVSAVPSVPFDGPQLPSDIWAAILSFTIGNSLIEIRNMVQLRSIQRGCAEASNSTNNLFWQRVATHLWDSIHTELFESYVHKYYNGYWFNLLRYSFGSLLAMPNFGMNPSRTCFASPLNAPKKPLPRWIRASKDENHFAEIIPTTLCAWNDSILFMTKMSEIVCLDTASGATRWIQSLSKCLNTEFTVLPSSPKPSVASLELRINAAGNDHSSGHFDFFEAASVVVLIQKTHIVSLRLSDGSLEWNHELIGYKAMNSILVLPHAIIVPVRDLKTGENFLLSLDPSPAIQTPEQRVQWKEAVPFEAQIAARPAANLFSSSLICFVKLSDGGAFFIFDLVTGSFIRSSIGRWIDNDSAEFRFGIIGENKVFFKLNDVDNGASNVNIIDLDNEIAPSTSAQEDNSLSDDEDIPDKPEFAPEGAGDCGFDEESNSVLVSGYWAGGGAAFNTSILSLVSSYEQSKESSTLPLRWELTDGDQMIKTSFHGAVKVKYPSFYGISFAAPIITSQGTSVWIGFSLEHRLLLIVDRNGMPLVNMILHDLNGKPLYSGDNDFDPEFTHSWISMARSPSLNQDCFICATPDWIWVAADQAEASDQN